MGSANTQGQEWRPGLGVDALGNVHIAWTDLTDGNDEIYYTKLDNNGNTLVDDTRLTSASGFSDMPSLTVDNWGNVHIAWTDDRDESGNQEIYYTKLDNNGHTVVDDTRLTSAWGYGWELSLGVDAPGNVHIAWMDERDGYDWEIYYTKLDNNGQTIVDDTQLTSAPNRHYGWEPSLGVDALGNVHIAWHAEGNPGINYIYYTKLDNNGQTIVDDTRLVSVSGYGYCDYPSLGIDASGKVHIAWADIRNDSTNEIYYTKGTTTGLSGAISGFVTLEDHSPITSATVELRQPGSGGLLDTATTDSKGYYEFVDLANDTYLLKAKKTGYSADTNQGYISQSQPWGKKEFVNFILR